MLTVVLRALIIAPVVLISAIGLLALTTRYVTDTNPPVGTLAGAVLHSPSGDSVGSALLTQIADGVVLKVEVSGLAPGAHGVSVNSVGSCMPSFAAAGEHFDPIEDSFFSFIHPVWRRNAYVGPHGGDLPNIHADDTGSAQADFFTTAMSLDDGRATSIFDSDGSSIVISEKPSTYTAESDTGDRVVCGVILPK